MFKRSALAAAGLLFAGSVFAGEATPMPEFENFQSTKTRAEVRAELMQARTEGLVMVGEAMPLIPAESMRSRAEVREELNAFIASGARDDEAVSQAG